MSAKMVNKEAAKTVSPRQWIRLVVVYLLIPLILLICGGGLGWWQAWLYSMLFLAASVGARMWAEQRHPGLTAERQNIENIQNGKNLGQSTCSTDGDQCRVSYGHRGRVRPPL